MRKKPSPTAVEWEEIDLANQLGPFCSLTKVQAVLKKYPAPGNPDYAYFQGFLQGRSPRYVARPQTIPGKLLLLDYLSKHGVDPCIIAKAEGRRDGLLIQLGELD